MFKDKSIVGDLINFRGLVYSPINENGVVFLFGRVVDDLHMYIEEIKPGYPDCVARRYTGKGWERIYIEFEYLSSNFKAHGHDPDICDIVVCWEHDWKDCPLEVIELKTLIPEIKNWPVRHPTAGTEPGVKGEEALKILFEKHKVGANVQDWYKQIEQAMHFWNEEIWTNIATRYIGMYSPERSFASFQPSKSNLFVECFSRDDPLPGTKVSNHKYSPRWAKFYIRQPDQIAAAIETLKESYKRLKEAMQAGETTGYFSGATEQVGEAVEEVTEGEG